MGFRRAAVTLCPSDGPDDLEAAPVGQAQIHEGTVELLSLEQPSSRSANSTPPVRTAPVEARYRTTIA